MTTGALAPVSRPRPDFEVSSPLFYCLPISRPPAALRRRSQSSAKEARKGVAAVHVSARGGAHRPHLAPRHAQLRGRSLSRICDSLRYPANVVQIPRSAPRRWFLVIWTFIPVSAMRLAKTSLRQTVSGCDSATSPVVFHSCHSLVLRSVSLRRCRLAQRNPLGTERPSYSSTRSRHRNGHLG